MDCKTIDYCRKILMVTDKDLLDFQYAEAIKAVCGKCKERNMPAYIGKQSVLDAALGHFHTCGFSLSEPDDHVLVLHFNGTTVACFIQSKATIEIIRKACRSYIAGVRHDRLD